MSLTGLGLFTRAAPRPMAIALDLGLRTAAPRADRPWACRVSVPLRQPGPDGLARQVAEIERLATIGRSVVNAAPSAVLAGAVTAAGVRTWLLYVPQADAIRDVGTADYPASVAVESDPAWAGYASLYPTETELADLTRRRAESDAVAAARSNTHQTVRDLRTSGLDLSRPGGVRYRMHVPAGTDLLGRAAAEGFRVELGPSLELVRDDLPDLALILRTERWLIREATRVGGRYAGWSAAEHG